MRTIAGTLTAASRVQQAPIKESADQVLFERELEQVKRQYPLVAFAHLLLEQLAAKPQSAKARALLSLGDLYTVRTSSLAGVWANRARVGVRASAW